MFSNEIIRFVNSVDELHKLDSDKYDQMFDKQYGKSYYEWYINNLKCKHLNNLSIFRPINRTIIHLEPKADKHYKTLLEFNYKTKASIQK